MSLGASIVSIVTSLICATDPPPKLDAQVVLWRHVSSASKEWPCTVLLRNTTSQPFYVAPGGFGATYTIWTTSAAGSKAMLVYPEPRTEETVAPNYPNGFVLVEPGHVITVPLRLKMMPEIADRAFEFWIGLSLYMHSEGRVERLSTTCTFEWSPDDSDHNGGANRGSGLNDTAGCDMRVYVEAPASSSGRAWARGLVNSRCGFGRRCTARGSTRSGRLPTR
jgi:hypothetical protein